MFPATPRSLHYITASYQITSAHIPQLDRQFATTNNEPGIEESPYGKPLILRINAGAMHANGILFYQAENEVDRVLLNVDMK